jgi:hypothetical protein
MVARNVRGTCEVKIYFSNAPAETTVKELLQVASSRWRMERCFEDQKPELGFDDFEGRSPGPETPSGDHCRDLLHRKCISNCGGDA